MPGPGLLQSSGGQAQKPTRFATIFTSRFFIGLFTNRSLLRGPLNSFYSDFYHIGTTDVLCDGLNTELSTQLTLIRRPGNPKFSTANIVSSPDSFYSFHRSDGTIQVIVDTSTDIEILTPSSTTSILTKATSAGEGYFQGVLNTLYIADGVDLFQYTPDGNTNPSTGTQLWNWGGAAPTSAPKLTVLPSGFGDPAWTASVFFSTMGIIQATPTGGSPTLYQLSSVNSNPNNPNTSQIGTSGNGQPVWNNAPNAATIDGGVTWQCSSTPIRMWTPLTAYPVFSVIWDPGTNGVYAQVRGTTFTSGGTQPVFVHSQPGSMTAELGLNVWCYLGVPGDTLSLWLPGHVYNTASLSDLRNTNSYNAAIIEPVIPTIANLTSGIPQIFVQFARIGGTSSSTFTQPNFPTTVGAVISSDGQLSWTCIGLSAYPTGGTQLVAWASGQATFSAYVDSNSNLQICTTAGIAGGSAPASPSPNYGSNTADGSTAIWTNCGSITNCIWRSVSKYYLPTAGFAPPTSAITFGGAAIVDSNSNQEFVIQSGFSGSTVPSPWSTTVGGQTTDNAGGGTGVGVIWVQDGPQLANSLTWTAGFGYVYAFKSRTLQDIYSYGTTVPASERVLPNLQSNYLPPPKGALTGDVTTASPAAIISTPNLAGGVITVSGVGSLDPQYDTVEIYRTTDGSQSGTEYLYLTDIPMPVPSGGQPGVWSIQDYMPDNATGTLSGLDPLILAPIAHQNDPPPGQTGSTLTAGGLIGTVYHQGRLWGFVGSTVYASGGPDTNPGNGFDAWPPNNDFPFQSNVVRLLPHTAGLLVFTTTDLYIIGGGPSFSTYYSQLLVPGLGILSWNAVAIIKGLPYVFTSDSQLISIDPSGGILRAGHPIGDKLVKFNPANVYLTYHTSGDLDHALFIGDGVSGWYRCDPSLAPDADTTGPVWSPFALVNGGNIKAIQSIETSPGVHSLLIGDSRANQSILTRDSSFTVFTDGGNPTSGVGGTAYDAYFTMGNIVLCAPGQMAELGFIEMDFVLTGTQPTVSVLLDELSATNGAQFETISNSLVSDPPRLYGPTATPRTIWMNRYYFGQTTPGNGGNQTPSPAWCKFLQLKVDYGTDTVKNECLTTTIFGALYQEK